LTGRFTLMIIHRPMCIKSDILNTAKL